MRKGYDFLSRVHPVPDVGAPMSRGSEITSFLDGLTHSQLAERQGVALGTLKSWIRRGLQKLRSCLEQ